jgi:transposase, IS5 family
MHQTRKGNQWYFGMKAHVGVVDSKTKLIHTAVATAANVSDVEILPDLLHGEETRVWGDGAYQGQTEVIRQGAPRAKDCTQRRCRYKGQIVDKVAWRKNRTKSKVRSKVEHVFQVMKLKFGFVKVRYRGTEEKRASFVCHLRFGQSIPKSQETALGGVTALLLGMAKAARRALETKF